MKWLHIISLMFGLAVSPVIAETLTLATDDGPPHMIQATDSGIDIDITRQVLNQLGYSVNVIYMPLDRARRSVKQGLVDMTVPTFASDDQPGYYLSDTVLTYRPTVFTLKQAGHQFASLSQIRELRVSTFQGATGYFSDAFDRMTKQNFYNEHPDMSVLPELLSLERVDVVVLDYYIFHYYAQEKLGQPIPTPFQAHSLIPAAPAYTAFHDRQLRDKFNQQLALFHSQGLREKVIRNYINPE